MKKSHILFLFIVLLCSFTAVAQQSKISHEVKLGGGFFLESGTDAQTPGVAARVGYGIDIPFASHISVMAGVGIGSQLANIVYLKADGVSADHFIFADALCQLRYNLQWERHALSLGIGPFLAVGLNQMEYGVEMMGTGYMGKEKYRRLNPCLLPSVSFYLNGHWMIGAEAFVGLSNVRIRYGEASHASTYLHTVALTLGYRF